MTEKLCIKTQLVFWVCFTLVYCVFVSCKKQEEPNSNTGNLSTMTNDEIRILVDRISEVEGIDPKNPRLQEDEIVSSIVILGERAAPYLVKKITDESQSKCAKWYKIGDVAHVLLCAIYKRCWPSQEFADQYELVGSGVSKEYSADQPYLNYYNRLLRTDDSKKNQENRVKLQEAWQKTVAEEIATSNK